MSKNVLKVDEISLRSYQRVSARAMIQWEGRKVEGSKWAIEWPPFTLKNRKQKYFLWRFYVLNQLCACYIGCTGNKMFIINNQKETKIYHEALDEFSLYLIVSLRERSNTQNVKNNEAVATWVCKEGKIYWKRNMFLENLFA